jgi:hypothetical protein
MPSVSAHLSQVFVAFTIEFDNEFEHRVPHRTTLLGGSSGPWLASMEMWSTCMRFVGEEPIAVNELAARARTQTNLNGMQRWGYITVGADKRIRATAKGLAARAVWAELAGAIEQRWEDRYGKPVVDRLRAALRLMAERIELDLPDCLPILGYGLWSSGPKGKRTGPVEPDLALSALMARVLLTFAMEYECGSEVSLAISANVLRVLNEEGIRLRDIPIMSGVSKESIAMAMGILRKGNYVAVEKAVRLTAKGVEAREAFLRRRDLLEEQWEGGGRLREALQPFTFDLLLQGMEPYPENWRAKVRRPEELPHYPMVLHRGGYPDGS